MSYSNRRKVRINLKKNETAVYKSLPQPYEASRETTKALADGDESLDICSFTVPLNHPAPITITQSNIYTTQPKKFYNCCPCLQKPEVISYQNLRGQTAPETIEVTSSPILRGEQNITTVEELRQITEELVSKPLYAKTNFSYHREFMNTIYFWSEVVIIVVDTTHPDITDKLKEHLHEAIRQMEQGISFCLKIDFTPSIQACMAKYIEPSTFLAAELHCTLTDDIYICLTNHSPPECDICLDKNCIKYCFPFWLCGGPCYYNTKSQRQRTQIFKVTCEIPE